MADQESRQAPSGALGSTCIPGTASLPSPRNPPEKRTSEGAAASTQKGPAPGALRPPSLRLQNPRSASQASGYCTRLIFFVYCWLGSGDLLKLNETTTTTAAMKRIAQLRRHDASLSLQRNSTKPRCLIKFASLAIDLATMRSLAFTQYNRVVVVQQYSQ